MSTVAYRSAAPADIAWRSPRSMPAAPPISAGRASAADARARLLDLARLRLLIVLGLFAAAAFVALARIVWLGGADPVPRMASLDEALLPERGELTDRNGMPLARAFPAYALWFNPQALGEEGAPLVRTPQEIADRLAAIIPTLDRSATLERLASGKPGYLHRRVLPEQANRVQALGELALEMPRESDRYYPQGMMAAHVLGYVGADGKGHVGMEQVLDARLTDPATRGRPVALSIDMRVQAALEDELRSTMLATDAIGAAGIVLDVDSGEVAALASLPEFDPNRIDRQGVGNMFNRVTNQVYELGSTFKPLTIAAAIDAGVVRDFAKPYAAGEALKVAGFRIRDSHTIGTWVNVPQSLIHSSNIVTARVADELGPERMRTVMHDLGMADRPHIELPAKGHPIWPGDDWSRIKTMTVGYGHGIAVTPLHLASAYATMVNGGVWRPATLMRLEPGEAPRGRRVFKESTSSRMRQLLRMIAVYGTGRNADAEGYRVGGKTGSAEKPGSGGYRRTSLVSTFAAAFPMDRPRYVVIAMLDEPKGTTASSFQRTASWNAAPIVGRLVPRIGPLLGVHPSTDRDIDISDLAPLVGGAH